MASLSANIVANLIGRAWPSLLGILFVPIYLRFMGVEAYGLVGFSATLQGVMGLLDLGISSTMTRELARLSVIKESNQKQRDLVRTLETLYWLISLAVGIIIVFLAPLLAQHWIKSHQLSPEQLTTAIQLMGVAVALQFPFALYQGGLMGLQYQVMVNAVLTVIGTLRNGGAVLVLWLVSPSITAFMGWQVIAVLVGSLTLMAILWRKLPKHEKRAKCDLSILREHWRYALTVASNGIIGVALVQSDKIILSYILPLEHFAYYTIASTVASGIWMMIYPLNNAIFPRLVQIHQKENLADAANIIHISSQCLSLLVLPISAILILYSNEILMIWTHDATVAANSKYIVILLVIGTTINGLSSIPATASMAFGWPQLVTKVNLIQAIVAVPAIALLSYYFQAIGAAFAWVGLNCTYLFFMAPRFFSKYMKKEMKDWYLKDLALPCAIAFGSLTLLSEFMSAIDKSVTMILLSYVFVLILTAFNMRHARHKMAGWIRFSQNWSRSKGKNVSS